MSEQPPDAAQPRRCIICGGLIVGRGMPVWTEFVGQGEPPLPIRWEEAHVECHLTLSDEDDAAEDDAGWADEG